MPLRLRRQRNNDQPARSGVAWLWQIGKRIVLLGLLLLGFSVWWLEAYDNYHCVRRGELYRSGQLSAPSLTERIASDGLRTVINLRPETNQLWHSQEQHVCEQAGVALVDFPLAGDQPPSLEQAAALLTILRQAKRPILVHCEHGADRTSFAVAIYLIKISFLPPWEASKAFSIRYGHLAFTRMKCFDNAFDQFIHSHHNYFPICPWLVIIGVLLAVGWWLWVVVKMFIRWFGREFRGEPQPQPLSQQLPRALWILLLLGILSPLIGVFIETSQGWPDPYSQNPHDLFSVENLTQVLLKGGALVTVVVPLFARHNKLRLWLLGLGGFLVAFIVSFIIGLQHMRAYL